MVNAHEDITQRTDYVKVVLIAFEQKMQNSCLLAGRAVLARKNQKTKSSASRCQQPGKIPELLCGSGKKRLIQHICVSNTKEQKNAVKRKGN